MIQIDFFSGPDCGVCIALKPKIKALVDQKFPHVSFNEIDITQQPEVAAQNMVFTLPVLIIKVDNREYYRFARSFSVFDVETKIQRLTELQ